jgi:hypothetical protein
METVAIDHLSIGKISYVSLETIDCLTRRGKPENMAEITPGDTSGPDAV